MMWTEDADAVLRRRWLAGHTAGEIATDLGVSRKLRVATEGAFQQAR
jgi:hypothetical protein